MRDSFYYLETGIILNIKEGSKKNGAENGKIPLIENAIGKIRRIRAFYR
jgi:hypothetical protein